MSRGGVRAAAPRRRLPGEAVKRRPSDLPSPAPPPPPHALRLERLTFHGGERAGVVAARPQGHDEGALLAAAPAATASRVAAKTSTVSLAAPRPGSDGGTPGTAALPGEGGAVVLLPRPPLRCHL